MKKRMYLFIAIFVGAHSLYAQDCATGYCPSTITVHHKAGDVSPVGGDMTYGVVKVGTGTSSTCWITSNLGASQAPGADTSYGSAVDGWLWQVNRKQGFVFGNWTGAVPSTSISVTGSDVWVAAQDPCTLLLGSAWHIPTTSEFSSIGYTWPNLGVKLNTSATAYMNGANPTVYSTPGGNGAYHVQNYGGTTIAINRINIISGGGGTLISAGATPSGLFSIRCVKLESK